MIKEHPFLEHWMAGLLVEPRPYYWVPNPEEKRAFWIENSREFLDNIRSEIRVEPIKKATSTEKQKWGGGL